MSKMQVLNLCTWPFMGQVAEGEDEVLKILTPSSEFTLTVSMLMDTVQNALETGKDVYSLRSYDTDGIRWRVILGS